MDTLINRVLEVVPSDAGEQIDLLTQIIRTTFRSSIRQYELQIAELRQVVQTRDSSIAHLQARVDAQTAELHHIKHDHDTLQQANDTLERQQVTLNDTVESLRNELSKVHQYRTLLSTSVNHLANSQMGTSSSSAASPHIRGGGGNVSMSMPMMSTPVGGAPISSSSGAPVHLSQSYHTNNNNNNNKATRQLIGVMDQSFVYNGSDEVIAAAAPTAGPVPVVPIRLRQLHANDNGTTSAIASIPPPHASLSQSVLLNRSSRHHAPSSHAFGGPLSRSLSSAIPSISASHTSFADERDHHDPGLSFSASSSPSSVAAERARALFRQAQSQLSPSALREYITIMQRPVTSSTRDDIHRLLSSSSLSQLRADTLRFLSI